MAELLPFEQIDAGGVDSHSNPINMPRNRALRCLNWVPQQAGYWQLRWGYTSVTMSSVTVSAISGMFPYRTWDGHKYVIFVQGTTLNVLDTATGTVTTPTVKGAAMASSATGTGFFGNNRFHYGNGTDQKWFDATTWRDSGLRQLSAADIANVVLTEGVRELTTVQASSITLTGAGGGSFPADSNGGRLVYVAFFDLSVSELGPSTIFVSAGRVALTLNQKITVAVMPNLSGTNANWVKLIGGTSDGGNIAYFFTNTSTAITNVSLSVTLVTITAAGHGLSTNDVVSLSGTVYFDGIYAVTVVDANKFTISLQYVPSPALTSNTGTVKRIVTAANAATTVDVLAPTQDTTYQMNGDRGVPASTIGGANPGYQFYGCIYNPNGGGHVGNRFPIGSRALQTAYRTNWRMSRIPTYTAPWADSEWRLLVGRTGDGAQVPYVCVDNADNWLFTGLQQSNVFVSDAAIDGAHEMPTRNGIIPSQCNMFCLAGDFVYAADTGSPTLRRSGSFADDRAGIFVGRPEQSWAPDDIDTFPTGEAITGMFEVDQEVLCGTLHDSAISVNDAGIQQWVGPWAVGIAGRRAGTKCGAHGFCWVSGDKQLITLQQGVPVPISEEYDLAELAQIGDQYLSAVELSYYRNPAQNKDELRIEGRKADGTPYTVIHDFKLREYSSAPGSIYGQGYSSQYVGPLATAFTVAQVRDGNGRLQIYAGASNGRIFQLYSSSDDAGNQYDSDLILLVNGGTNRPAVPFIDWYGDGAISVSLGQTLSTSLDPAAQFQFEPLTPPDNAAQVVQGSENDFLFRAYLDVPEIQHAYLRFQLTSHSGDGNLNPSVPPHIPLENYGRLYELIPAVGDQRER